MLDAVKRSDKDLVGVLRKVESMVENVKKGKMGGDRVLRLPGNFVVQRKGSGLRSSKISRYNSRFVRMRDMVKWQIQRQLRRNLIDGCC